MTLSEGRTAEEVAREIVKIEQAKCHRDGAGGVHGCVRHIRYGETEAGGRLIEAIASALRSAPSVVEALREARPFVHDAISDEDPEAARNAAATLAKIDAVLALQAKEEGS
jgi:hypothetical protein